MERFKVFRAQKWFRNIFDRMYVVVVGPKYSAKTTEPTSKILKIFKKLAYQATIDARRCINLDKF